MNKKKLQEDIKHKCPLHLEKGHICVLDDTKCRAFRFFMTEKHCPEGRDYMGEFADSISA